LPCQQLKISKLLGPGQIDFFAQLKKELESMEAELLEVFKELGVQDGDQYTIEEENRQEFFNRQIEIGNIEVEIPVPDINIDDLLNIETDEYWSVLLDKLLKKE
jgi:hypothetical protein